MIEIRDDDDYDVMKRSGWRVKVCEGDERELFRAFRRQAKAGY